MREPYTLPNYVCQDFVVVNQCTYCILINDILDLLILVHRRSKHTEDLVTTSKHTENLVNTSKHKEDLVTTSKHTEGLVTTSKHTEDLVTTKDSIQ